MRDADPHKACAGPAGTGKERLRYLEEALARTEAELEEARARLRKWRVERELARKAADGAYEIVKRQNEELREQVERFRKFVPESLSAVLNRRGFDVSRGISLERTYSVLTTDIRDFTAFSESITCQECFRFLNSFFTVMEPGIRRFGGFVYQYVGDSITALFPLEEGGHADNAVSSAIHLQHEVMPRYNEGRRKAGYEPIRIGIGVNTGSVATGVAGTQERMDACAFGNTVNLAARCESLTKEIGADLIITAFTRSRLRNAASYLLSGLGETEIRGMASRVELYRVEATAAGPAPRFCRR